MIPDFQAEPIEKLTEIDNKDEVDSFDRKLTGLIEAISLSANLDETVQ